MRKREKNLQTQPQQEAGYQQPQPQKRNGLGIASLVMGIIAIIGSWMPLFNKPFLAFAIIALSLGILGVIIGKTKNRSKGSAKAGLTLGIISIILFVVSNAVVSNTVRPELLDIANDMMKPSQSQEADATEDKTLTVDEVQTKLNTDFKEVTDIDCDNITFNISSFLKEGILVEAITEDADFYTPLAESLTSDVVLYVISYMSDWGTNIEDISLVMCVLLIGDPESASIAELSSGEMMIVGATSTLPITKDTTLEYTEARAGMTYEEFWDYWAQS
ncbi:MAG: CD20-like domain-containing protein [Clostridiales bacterium]|nr:CD20-like domain-containing protein [Clostridiales bacterium]